MTPILVEKGTTALYVKCNPNGTLSKDSVVSIFPFLKSTLTEYEYDFRRKVNVVKYSYYRYDRKTNILHMPVNILMHLETYFRSNCVKYDVRVIPPYESAEISTTDTGAFEERDYQTDAIDFLVDTNNPGMKALELQTGKGKSFIAVKAIMRLRKRTIIIVPASLLVQWIDAFNAICEARVGVIRGNKTIGDLISANYSTDVDVFLASITTMQEYACGGSVYNVFPSIREFFRNMKFGVKIVDECHLNFYANMMIDIQSDIENNLYLSATYMRSSKNSQQIFRRIFPDEIKYEGNSYDRYVDITECRYSLGDIPEKYVVRERGYDQFRYEKFIMRKSKAFNTLVNRVLCPLIDEYYIGRKRDGQKLLILVGLKEFAELLTSWFLDTYPDLKSVAFLGGVDDEELVNSDIIVSTMGSAGVGRDIKNLRTVIMFISFSSESRTLQSLGRLRKLSEDTPEFVYMINTGIAPHIKHANIRRPIYKYASKTFTIVEV